MALNIPANLDDVLEQAWTVAREVPGYLTGSEARFLGMVAACAPCDGAVVEIGSFKGKSTVMLAKIAQSYGLPPVVAIDPHNFNCPEFAAFKAMPGATSYREFLRNLRSARVDGFVEPRQAYSGDVARTWNAPIRLLWIDGDHSYAGTKADFDGFIRHVADGGVVAFHDALHEYAGPIRVFVEEVLRSGRFGAAGFAGSIAWAQVSEDGALFESRRKRLDAAARRLIPFVERGEKLRGLRKMLFKLNRSLVPRGAMRPSEWAEMADRAR